VVAVVQEETDKVHHQSHPFTTQAAQAVQAVQVLSSYNGQPHTLLHQLLQVPQLITVVQGEFIDIHLREVDHLLYKGG
jgi:DnaJ-domain-containing protein 1